MMKRIFLNFWSDYFIPSWRKNCYRLWSQIFSCNVQTIIHLDEKLIFGRSSWIFQTLEEFRSQCFLQLEGRQFILKGCRLASDAHKITTWWLKKQKHILNIFLNTDLNHIVFRYQSRISKNQNKQWNNLAGVIVFYQCIMRILFNCKFIWKSCLRLIDFSWPQKMKLFKICKFLRFYKIL